jgi:hypothetical protein
MAIRLIFMMAIRLLLLFSGLELRSYEELDLVRNRAQSFAVSVSVSTVSSS